MNYSQIKATWIDITNIIKMKKSKTKNIYSIFHSNKAKKEGGTKYSVKRCMCGVGKL